MKSIRLHLLLLMPGLVAASAGWAQSCHTLILPPHYNGSLPPPLPANVALPPRPAPFNCPTDCTLTIGSTCSDGTIYAGTSPDGSVPMYTTPCDVGQTLSGTCTGSRLTKSWNNGTGNVAFTSFTSAVTGRANTQGLVALSGAGSPYNAAAYCAGLTTGGHNDWYLPAKNELNVMYTNRVAIGGFETVNGDYYWSSTDYDEYSGSDGSYAMMERFTDGSAGDFDYSKNVGLYVRCARR